MEQRSMLEMALFLKETARPQHRLRSMIACLTETSRSRAEQRNVTLHNSQLTGWINENKLTGASRVNPNDPAAAFANLPPANVKLIVDPSTWRYRLAPL